VKAAGKGKRKGIMQKTPHDKAADTVQKTIERAISRVEKHMPKLGQHLREHLDTGLECEYKGNGLAWAIS
jgi:hypothetical protein